VDEVYICELCQRAYESVEGSLPGLRILKTFNGFTVDLRLQQFRRMKYGQTQQIIAFSSPEGNKLLAQMHEKVTR